MLTTLKSILEKYPLFIITIFIFFLLHNNNFYFSLIDWALLAWDIVIYLLFSIIVYILLATVMRSWKKAGVLSFALLMIFYFFQSFHDFIKSTPFIALLGRYVIVLPLTALIIFILCVYLKKPKTSLQISTTWQTACFWY